MRGTLCALDVEDDGIDVHDIWNFVVNWNARTKHPLILYTSDWFWKGRLGNPNARSLHIPLWDSEYVAGKDYAVNLYDDMPQGWWSPNYGGWAECTFIQFSNKAKIAGKALDANAYRDSDEKLLRLAGDPMKLEISNSDIDKIAERVANKVINDKTIDEVTEYPVGHGKPASSDQISLEQILRKLVLLAGGQKAS